MDDLSQDEIARAVKLALEEDVGAGDATTLATVPEQTMAIAHMVAREPLVVAGLAFAQTAFSTTAPPGKIELPVRDGAKAGRGEKLLTVHGPARGILTAERVALNFVQRLSGVATATARYVEAIAGTNAKILDTRKTTPGWRRFEKYAVRCGGGHNHRIGLYDMILIKDNHLAAIDAPADQKIARAIQRARAAYPKLKIEIEADTLVQVQQAIAAGAEMILCDNMSPSDLREAVRMAKGRAKLEASGGINLDTVRAVAETGVDFISVGALTHSARAVDVALDFENL
jgi:nicotinate-nucleotide pyrophosphorylase (carboxylating)